MLITVHFSWYSTSLVGGGALGNVIAGLVTIHYTWRTTYYVTTALVGLFFVLMFFTMPETSFKRRPTHTPNHVMPDTKSTSEIGTSEKGMDISHIESYQSRSRNKKTYVEQLRIFNGSYVDEPLLKIFIRPFGVLLLPPVFWSTMVTAGSVGFLIAVNTNIGSAFQMVYGWKTYQIGLTYTSAFIGALLGIFGGGHFSDWVANVLTKRNKGMREPEMRLPSLMAPVILMTISMVLYGVTIQNGMHWMVPTFALGLRKREHLSRTLRLLKLMCSNLLCFHSYERCYGVQY
jgi:MFS family permease